MQDKTHWTDGEGKVLPDAFVAFDGIEARKCAYKVHSDLGDGFIKGIDGKTKRVVGADHCCQMEMYSRSTQNPNFKSVFYGFGSNQILR